MQNLNDYIICYHGSREACKIYNGCKTLNMMQTFLSKPCNTNNKLICRNKQQQRNVQWQLINDKIKITVSKIYHKLV